MIYLEGICMSALPTALTPEQIEQLRAELQRTLCRLEKSMATNGNGKATDIDQSAVGRLSRIEAIQNAGFTQNLKARERQQLEEVLAALTRMEEGVYGLCTACQGPIRFERLQVFPETRTCNLCGTGSN
jgi:DnaK suppressor protein